jgi:hypothetical protein
VSDRLPAARVGRPDFEARAKPDPVAAVERAAAAFREGEQVRRGPLSREERLAKASEYRQMAVELERP